MTTLLAYFEIALFLFTEGRLRSGKAAKSLEQGAFDRNSTRRIGQAFFIVSMSLLAAPLLNWVGVWRLRAPALGWLGLVFGLLGLGLRAWANRTLGKFYTRTLQVAGEQEIVQNGPYHLVRHPGYLGMILLWFGAALAVQNGIVIILALLVMFAVYAYRIRVEEQMLLAIYGERYAQYRARTWKLIPLIY